MIGVDEPTLSKVVDNLRISSDSLQIKTPPEH